MADSPSYDDEPLFSAVSSSARQLYLLLRCVGFSPKAQVQITQEGLKVTVEESRVMQGLVFLDKALFTTFTYRPRPLRTTPGDLFSGRSETTDGEDGEEGNDGSDEAPTPAFQISLHALLETLQIFGLDNGRDRSTHDGSNPYPSSVVSFAPRGHNAFDRRVLGMAGVCRLRYDGPGAAFSIVLEESGVTTTCDLVTYEPDASEGIPLQRDRLAQKIIMRATWLYDAITELAAIAPTRLTITASPSRAPYLALSAAGPLGSAAVEFSKDPQLLETFQVARRTVNTYNFSLIRHATRAMSIASKVSVRADEQGVLSLQFMIERDHGGISFVDFRFVPSIAEEGDDDDGDGDGDGDDDNEDVHPNPEAVATTTTTTSIPIRRR
ncbi:MAG: ssDNA endodeoxyribonuclease [Phylliscum demangeonii]|nr:MAG: ssDNA endodeoxyribonuclease [Phylliscum demangeonii]